jgi:hypothetical protein
VNDASDDGGAPPPAKANGERVIVWAPIDELELIVRESAPPQYAVRVVAGLPDGCTEFFEVEIAGRAGTTVKVEVMNTVPSGSDVICTAIYGTHEEIIELGTDFEPGTEYAVKVNDEELKFTAQ